MTSTRRRRRLQELNRQAEDPNLWNDQQRAQRVMQERTALEDQLTAIGRIEQELDDQLTMIELGEAEKDQSVVNDAEAALKKLKAEVARRELEALLVGRGRFQRQLSRSPCRRRRHREPGLGQHAAAHVHALGRAARLQDRISSRRPPAKRPGSSRRPSRSRAATPMAGSRPRTACTAWCASRRSIPTRAGTRRLPASTVYPVIDDRIKVDIKESDVRTDTMRAQRRRRTARQQDRVRDPAHPYPDQHRGLLPERPLAAPQPRAGLADAARATLRSGIEEARGAGGHRPGQQDRHRLGPSDPQLCAAALSDGEGPAHRRADLRHRRACSTATSTRSWRRRWRRRRSAPGRRRSRTWSR